MNMLTSNYHDCPATAADFASPFSLYLSFSHFTVAITYSNYGVLSDCCYFRRATQLTEISSSEGSHIRTSLARLFAESRTYCSIFYFFKMNEPRSVEAYDCIKLLATIQVFFPPIEEFDSVQNTFTKNQNLGILYYGTNYSETKKEERRIRRVAFLQCDKRPVSRYSGIYKSPGPI